MRLPRFARNDGMILMRFTPLKIYLPVLAMALSVPTQAAEWWAQPDVTLRSGYNDNVRLTSAPHDSVWETDLDIASGFGVAKENQGLNGRAAVKIRRFTGGTGRNSSEILDREDYFLSANAYHQTELNVFRANFAYTQDSTLDSDLDESGVVISQRATRISKTLGASWARTLTEKLQSNLDYQHNDVSYRDDPFTNNLIAYKSDVASASLGYQYTPRTQINLVASGSSFRPDTGFNSETLNIQAGITRSFSETLSMSLLGGYRNTTSDSLFATGFCIGADSGSSFPECNGGTPVFTGTEKGETETSGPTYAFSLTKILERGSLSADLSRTTSPGQNGQLFDRNRILLAGEHRLTARLRSSLRIEYTENETIVNFIGREPDDVTEKFFRVTPRVSWQWLREWTIGGEYRYARNENRALQTATQNAVYLTLSYVPTRLSISR